MKYRIVEHTTGIGTKLYGVQLRECKGLLFGGYRWTEVRGHGTDFYWLESYAAALERARRDKAHRVLSAEIDKKWAETKKTIYHEITLL